MKKKQIPLLKIALVLSAFFLWTDFSAQTDILELLPGSKKAHYYEKNDLMKLEGNVNFKYQGNIMYCDSAYYFEKSRIVRTYGRVHIIKGKINLFCDSALFNGKNESANLWGNVRVRDVDYRLTTDSLEYFSSNGRAVYRNYGVIKKIGSNEKISSRVGYFYPDTKNYYFRDSVVYLNDGIRMTTDTLDYDYFNQKTIFLGETTIVKDSMTMICNFGWYDTKNNQGYLHGNASYEDDKQILYADTIAYDENQKELIAKLNVHYIHYKNNYTLNSNYLYSSDSTELTYIADCALGRFIHDKDTMYIHSDSLFIRKDSTNKKNIEAYKGVKIFNKEIQSICDSLSYIESQNVMSLYYDPVVWTENSELKGDSIKIYIRDSLIDQINIYDHSSVLMELDSGALYNQIAGRDIIAFMKKGKLHKTDVNGSAVSIYYPEDEENTDSLTTIKRLGLNKLESATLTVYLDSGEVIGINYVNQPVGVFYPMDQIKERDRWITNFKWNEFLRPKDYINLSED